MVFFMNLQGNYEFNSWWVKNEGEFVSHATRHHKNICESKTLKCAEEIFRLTGAVEHESGVFRGTSTTFPPSQRIYQYFIYHTQIGNGDDENPYPNCYVVPDFVLDSGLLQELERKNPEHRIEDHGSFVKLFSSREYICHTQWSLYEADVFYDSVRNDNLIQAIYVPPLFEINKRAVSYEQDESSGRKIDASLRDIYQHCLREQFSPNHIAYELYCLRQKVFSNHSNHLAFDIRVEKNGVRWSYGDVAILIGNPRSRLSWEGQFSDTRAKKMEFHLLNPFQVSQEEGFHKVSLDDPSVVIVGTDQAIDSLRQNANIDPGIKSRLFSVKTLTKSSRLFYNRPLSKFVLLGKRVTIYADLTA